MTVVRALARPLLSTIFVVQGAKAIRNPEPLVTKAQPVADRMVPADQEGRAGAGRRPDPRQHREPGPAERRRPGARRSRARERQGSPARRRRAGRARWSRRRSPGTASGRRPTRRSGDSEGPVHEEPGDHGRSAARRGRHRGQAGRRLAGHARRARRPSGRPSAARRLAKRETKQLARPPAARPSSPPESPRPNCPSADQVPSRQAPRRAGDPAPLPTGALPARGAAPPRLSYLSLGGGVSRG